MRRMPYSQTLKDRATQLYIKYKIGALVTQYQGLLREKTCTRTKKAMLHTRRLSCLKNLDMSSGIYSYGRLNKNVGKLLVRVANPLAHFQEQVRRGTSPKSCVLHSFRQMYKGQNIVVFFTLIFYSLRQIIIFDKLDYRLQI